ncbi:TPA: hypothetical protein DIU27_04390 [Candidatus Collierbacteria bacterium]|uniref:Uncharacterized protein n=1 Tax=Candidatus Collierbacteria bacterium GW2011_GWB2_44_22 TaxID=1618387 RepID=A0A0G1HXP6_9BACT|nr:MAG: hypothetical protein UW31_C0013G0029 [Candidatus Collierbacteria bacterium GW2011_GWA2_44_13]KKT51710.1 MAG: hypothetical protein UW44_C0008G0032 [Candidatus Collierbacteria bacterium GW2011_GWB2_44_22]KKT62507.1 MAG: hypothetical protein UW56_C0006G0030 [Candidatus Collierbacteria bacterium GW2011_GWD1_44_27]KKT66929.1 MAG: hypothetical protein UW58_C0001G0033 [Candidatus Collierbacteria bacterium GW2011_GWC2_44_30]KKT88756.1 MAG: hypothetical protein UW88_C0008G0030 [Candidatus Collie
MSRIPRYAQVLIYMIIISGVITLGASLFGLEDLPVLVVVGFAFAASMFVALAGVNGFFWLMIVSRLGWTKTIEALFMSAVVTSFAWVIGSSMIYSFPPALIPVAVPSAGMLWIVGTVAAAWVIFHQAKKDLENNY